MITAEQALETLEEIVAEFGDGYVYPEELRREHWDTCVYATPDDVPRCIVGQALRRWGLLANLKSGDTYMNGAVGGVVQGRTRGEISHEALDVLSAAQKLQDARKTWGEALVAAKEQRLRLHETRRYDP